MTAAQERGRRGFTLVELALVLLIAGILAATAVTVYMGMVSKARMTQAPVALKHLKKTQTIYFSDENRYTDDVTKLDFDPVKYDYYTISVALVDNTGTRGYIGYARGRAAMAGDLWTVTDNTEPVQDNSSPFRPH